MLDYTTVRAVGVEGRVRFWPEDRANVISLRLCVKQESWITPHRRGQAVDGVEFLGRDRSASGRLCLTFWINIRCLLNSSLWCLWQRGWPEWIWHGSSLHCDLRESPFLGSQRFPQGPVMPGGNDEWRRWWRNEDHRSCLKGTQFWLMFFSCENLGLVSDLQIFQGKVKVSILTWSLQI